jgi:hypothetical protein
MKFKCPKNKPFKDTRQWHKWFAWHPVKTDNNCIWLEFVYRKGTNHISVPYDRHFSWEYKECLTTIG